MNKLRAKILKFVKLNWKQIVFALFAFLYGKYFGENDLNLCAAPLIAAGAIAAAGETTAGTAVAVGAAAATGGTSTAAGASTAAGTGAAAGAAAGTSAAAGASTAAGTGAATSETYAKVAANNLAQNTNTVEYRRSMKANIPQNTNPSVNNMSSNAFTSSELDSANPLDKGNVALDDMVSKESLEASSESEIQKDKKRNKLFNFNGSREEDEDDEDESMDKSADSLLAGAKKAMPAIIIFTLLLPILIVPLIFISITNPITSTLSQTECVGEECEEEETSGFLNKIKNLVKYGTYGENYEVLTKRLTEISDEIVEKYNIQISKSLLLSTMYSDSEVVNLKSQNGKITLSDKMLERIDYLEDLAYLQLIEDEVAVACKAKVVGGEVIYYKEADYTVKDTSNLVEAECNEMTAGMTIKEVMVQYSEEQYFLRLKTKTEMLDDMYDGYEGDEELLVSKIKTMYDVYKELYGGLGDDEAGTVPLSLFYDSKVNLTSPLKGSYAVTSPFGNRDGLFAGMHKGIDMVSNDKTIYAAGDGIVTRANTETVGGNIIEITHTDSNGDQYITQYAHLSKFLVSYGEKVKAGSAIGIMGTTGTGSTGVHLHFQMWKKEPYTLYNPKNVFSNLVD